MAVLGVKLAPDIQGWAWYQAVALASGQRGSAAVATALARLILTFVFCANA